MEPSGFLQYGALGLLALVLVGVGLWIRQALSKNQQFMEKLAMGAIDAQVKYTEAFQAVSLRAIAAQETSTAASEKVAACMTLLTDQSSQSHHNLADGLDKLRKGQLTIMKRQSTAGG